MYSEFSKIDWTTGFDFIIDEARDIFLQFLLLIPVFEIVMQMGAKCWYKPNYLPS